MSLSLFEQINEHIKEAMKAKDKDRLEALRMLKAKFIENKTSAKPREEMDVVISYTKMLKDSMESFPAGHEARPKIENEMKILSVYLPQAMAEEEVKAIIQSIIAKQPGMQMGMVMKELTPQIKGRFDGKRANDLVKAALG